MPATTRALVRASPVLVDCVHLRLSAHLQVRIGHRERTPGHVVWDAVPWAPRDITPASSRPVFDLIEYALGTIVWIQEVNALSQGPTVDQLRRQFIDFFAQRDHRVMPSASLIPQSPSTLLTGAGMQPFVPAFRGEAEPPARNVVTAQKCVRSGDIEEVGRTARHHTFFEMMGNFSFGGYFKQGAIDLAWELVHGVWGIDADLCWVSVYLDDDESAELWHTRAGIPRERILRMGKADNWWPQTAWDGPCGPCTEIYVDQGPSIWCDAPDKGPASKGDRFLEIWNLVFQMYNQSLDGSLAELATPGIDTGLGLERLAAVLQGVPSNFDIDIFAPTLEGIARVSREIGNGVAYGDSETATVSYRAIADHLRAVTFMIGDKILPSNEGRGYVLRRILRRAFRFARNLGIRQPFLHSLVPVVIESMSVGYPELVEQRATISKIVRTEEERFCATLEQGMAHLEQLIADVRAKGGDTLPGDEVFRLYDTLGFHLEFTRELAEEQNLKVDEEGYQRALERQRSRSQFRFTESAAAKAFYVQLSEQLEPSVFERDWEDERATVVQAIVGEEALLAEAEEGARCALVLGPTPFYPERGGQASDQGVILTSTGEFAVSDVQEPVDGVILHIGHVQSGRIEPRQSATAHIDRDRRDGIRRAHSATHLLHRALRDELGLHVAQAGSLVERDRLRFDFSHFEAVTPEQLDRVERAVQENALRGLPVTTEIMPLERAREAGAVALFGERYAAEVRVVTMGDYTKELCGGTHLENTAALGPFVIVSESSVAAGTRRIEALTGLAAAEYVRSQRSILQSAARALGSPIHEVPRRIDDLQALVRDLRKEIQDLKRRGAGASVDSLVAEAREVAKGVKIVAVKMDGADHEELSGLADRLVEKDPAVVAVVMGVGDGKVPIVCKAGPEAIMAGANAGKLAGAVAQVCGGGGGGRAEFARAGGRDMSKADEALARAPELLRELLS